MDGQRRERRREWLCFDPVSKGSLKYWMSPLEHISMMCACLSGTRKNDVLKCCGCGLLQIRVLWSSAGGTGTRTHRDYPVECVRPGSGEESELGSRSHLLYTLQFQFDISTHSFVMDETRIALIGSHYTRKLETGAKKSMTALNLANFAERKSSDLKMNSEDNEDVKMKIIYDPFSIRTLLFCN